MTDVQDLPFTSEEHVQDRERKLREAKEQIAGPVPLMAEAPDCSLRLQRGLFVKGVHKTDVLVRELTGADEETLAKAREPGDHYDTVIALGVEKIDDFDLSELPLAERQGYLRQLLIGERDQIFLAIVKVTFGEEKVVAFRCLTCAEEQEMSLLLSEDFKPKEVVDLDKAIFTFTTSKGQVLDYRLVTGEDQREAFQRKGATTADQNTIILSRIIGKLNGGLIPDPVQFVRQMSMRDRAKLLEAVVSKQPVINLEVTTNCAACQSPQTLNLGWGDLFRP